MLSLWGRLLLPLMVVVVMCLDCLASRRAWLRPLLNIFVGIAASCCRRRHELWLQPSLRACRLTMCSHAQRRHCEGRNTGLRRTICWVLIRQYWWLSGLSFLELPHKPIEECLQSAHE